MGKQTAQSAKQCSIWPGQPRRGGLAAEDGDFVAQDEDLDVLGGC